MIREFINFFVIDAIGMLDTIAPTTFVNLSNGKGLVTKKDVYVKMLRFHLTPYCLLCLFILYGSYALKPIPFLANVNCSGDTLRVCLWEDIISQIDVPTLL